MIRTPAAQRYNFEQNWAHFRAWTVEHNLEIKYKTLDAMREAAVKKVARLPLTQEETESLALLDDLRKVYYENVSLADEPEDEPRYFVAFDKALNVVIGVLIAVIVGIVAWSFLSTR